MTTPPTPYWKTTALADMSDAQWEALCDGCGKCCLHKMIDDDDEVIETNVACRLLDLDTIRCSRYPERKRFVADCTILTPSTATSYDWLPGSCAYVRLAKGEDLPAWHHLLTGDHGAMHEGGHSVKGRIISEREAGPLEHHIVDGWDQ